MLKNMLKLAAIGMAVTACSAAETETGHPPAQTGTARPAQAGTAHRDLQKEEANRRLIQQILDSDNIELLIEHMADDYKQHNPTVADGKQGAIAFFADLMKRHPDTKARPIHIAADGDLVWIHAHLTRYPGDLGLALVDIFRIKDGKLVEHWDVMQPVPEKSANGNSMF